MSYAAILQGAFSGGTAGGNTLNTAPRAAVLFTSRLRSSQSSIIQAQRLSHYKSVPGSWLQSTIVMAVNPNSVKFVQSKRITKKDTREGSVYFHFTNSKGQNNDILGLQFAGNTGNIDLRGSLGGLNTNGRATQTGANGEATAVGPDTGALYKLQVWQNLYLLTREPVLLADNMENTWTLSYSSALFPVSVDFTGFFAKVLEFDETGAKPNSRNYSFEFTVTSTDPDLDELLSTMDSLVSSPPQTVSVPEFANPVDGSLLIDRNAGPAGDTLPDSSETPNIGGNPIA